MNALFFAGKSAPAPAKKDKVLYCLAAGFFVTLYMGPVLNNLFIGALFLYSFFVDTTGSRIQVLRGRKDLLLIIAFYLWNAVSAFLSHDLAEGLSMLQLRVPLLLFPLSLGSLRLRETERDRILLCYALVHTLASLACLAGAFVQCRVHGGDTQYLYDDSLSSLVHIQSVYFALMTEIAVFVFIYLLGKGSVLLQVGSGAPAGTASSAGYASSAGDARPFRGAWWTYACIAFLLVFHFMLASRIGLILMYSGLLVFAGGYFFIRTQKWRQGLIFVVLLLSCIGGFMLFFPKTLNRFHELEYTDYHYDSHGMESHYNMKVTPDQWNGANIRLAIWNCAWTVAREHLWSGVPLGDKRETLVREYRNVHFDFAVKSRRNTHNTYLDVLVTFGLPGLLLFLAGFAGLPLVRLSGRKEYLGMAVVLVFLASMVTETYIDRSLGCVLLGFFLSVF